MIFFSEQAAVSALFWSSRKKINTIKAMLFPYFADLSMLYSGYQHIE